jgi:hypothetical protein
MPLSVSIEVQSIKSYANNTFRSHLLGKKSWNVYNTKNIERVRRDEAAAKAAEEAEEQRMQELDAERRLAILRGEVPPPLPEPNETQRETNNSSLYPSSSGRRKRTRPGEDDTDFELRLANERAQPQGTELEVSRKPSSSAPIVDRDGHIDLFGDELSQGRGGKNEEAEREKKRKKQEYEDQYTMRLANAAGKGGPAQPWYQTEQAKAPALSKDAWGNDDPKRKDRDAQRIAASDPLAMMKKGASKVRELKAERKKFREEQDEEISRMRAEERRRERREKRDDRHDRHRRDGDERERRRHQHRDDNRDRDRGRSHARSSRSPRRERYRDRYD